MKAGITTVKIAAGDKKRFWHFLRVAIGSSGDDAAVSFPSSYPFERRLFPAPTRSPSIGQPPVRQLMVLVLRERAW